MKFLELKESADPSTATFLSRGATFTVNHLSNIGVLCELHLSDLLPTVRRQEEMAEGYSAERLPLKIVQNEEFVSIQCNDGSELRVNENTGALSMICGENTCWSSGHEAVSFAAEPVNEYEDTNSKYFANLMVTNPPSWIFDIFKGTRFETVKVRGTFTCPPGPILGLPGSTGEFDRGGYRFELYNTDRGLHTPGRYPMYQSWPILFFKQQTGPGWCGIFWDNPSRTFVDCGDYEKGSISFESSWGNARFLICAGDTLTEAAAKMQRFLGASLFPPAWAFGYQQSRWSYMSSNEVRNVVKEFRTHQIPLDCIHFDIDYMEAFKVFTNDKTRFADLRECVQELSDSGVQSVAIVDPGIKVDEDYSVYKELRDSGSYFKEPDGSPMLISAWPGKCLLPDYTNRETRAWWSTKQKEWLESTGIVGVWNDMNEPTNWGPGNAQVSQALCSSGRWAPDYNLYGYRMAQASYGGFKRSSEAMRRPFVISRSGYPGIHSYAVIWHGDNHSWWEHLKLALETCVSYSLCGAVFTGPDIPGFDQNAPDDLAIRFFQLGSFLPFFRGHSSIFSDPKEPYRYAPETRRIITDAIRLRYSLMREWYSGTERLIRERRPVMQPVFRDDRTLVKDHFILFDKFLVAPVMERAQFERAVYLPAGGVWYELGKPETPIEGGRMTLVPVTLESIPVYVRDGVILTRNEPMRNVPDTLQAPEKYEIYSSNGKASGYWFDDLNSAGSRSLALECTDGINVTTKAIAS